MFNQITLVGNVGQDPEMRYTPSGQPVTSFSLAVNKSWVGADGQRQDKTLWFRVTCWRKLAETVSQYVKKGSKVLVVGEIEEARPWTDKDGNNRASLDVTASAVRFLDSKPQAEAMPEAQRENAAWMRVADEASREDIPF